MKRIATILLTAIPLLAQGGLSGTVTNTANTVTVTAYNNTTSDPDTIKCIVTKYGQSKLGVSCTVGGKTSFGATYNVVSSPNSPGANITVTQVEGFNSVTILLRGGHAWQVAANYNVSSQGNW